MIKKLHKYLFDRYITYDDTYKYNRNSCIKCNYKFAFKMGTTKFYMCTLCHRCKTIYLTRWIRI